MYNIVQIIAKLKNEAIANQIFPDGGSKSDCTHFHNSIRFAKIPQWEPTACIAGGHI